MLNKILNKVLKIVKVMLVVFLLLLGIAGLVFVIAGLLPVKNPTTPAGYKKLQAVYVTMKDGTKIAVRIELPSDLQKGEKIPAIVESTRYACSKPSFLMKALIRLFNSKERMEIFVNALNESGYAFVRVDARGSGASFGTRTIEFSKEEVEDYGQVIDWIAKQEWSNGKVGSYGVSYSGNTAELAAASGHPALRVVAPLYSDFDIMKSVIAPGGIIYEWMINGFGSSVADMDANRMKSIFTDGIPPVDADKSEVQLKQAIAQHKNNFDVASSYKKVTYYDDPVAEGYTANSASPFYYKNQIEASSVPMYIRVGWQDAGTAEGAIERFLTFNNSQTLVIGPWNHAGYYFYDPFLTESIEGQYASEKETIDAQVKAIIEVYDSYLKDDVKDSSAPTKQIKYYTYGEGVWKSTKTWPVSGFENKTLYFQANGGLKETKPNETEGKDAYKVDFTASTGETNRWRTNLGAGPVFYPDRQEEDKKLLTYTSDIFEKDIEITGSPIVTLNVTSTAADGNFIVYLEDVAPGGKVTYITEGELRALHRKVIEEDLGHAVLGPKHSFLKKDGMLIKKGEVAQIQIGMHPTSVLIRKGHRIRIAVAGHDASVFRRIPESQQPVIEIQRNSVAASFVELPMKSR